MYLCTLFIRISMEAGVSCGCTQLYSWGTTQKCLAFLFSVLDYSPRAFVGLVEFLTFLICQFAYF